MFIEQLNFTSDLDQIHTEVNKIYREVTWGRNNQICLNHKPGDDDIWFGGSGSLYDKTAETFISDESEFDEWNVDTDSYIRQQIELLQETHNIKTLGRIRLMRLMPKTGLSVHSDREFRYHLVLRTNPQSFIVHNIFGQHIETPYEVPVAVCYHMPMNGHWFKVDTRQTHWVYNGGSEPRVHLVVCGE